jgi:thiamine pyrophosphokinase
MEVLVFANGTIGEETSAQSYLRSADLILCADGGIRHVRALRVQPDVVIGDMDSIAPRVRAEMESAGIEFITFPTRKDETDLELALLWAAERGASRITVLGGRGDRIDHELGNVLLLAHPGLTDVDVRLACGSQEVVLVRGERTFHGSRGDLLSLLPIGGDARGITTSGLEYPLDGESLYLGPARGVSNVLTAERATVRLSSGLLLAVHTRILSPAES